MAEERYDTIYDVYGAMGMDARQRRMSGKLTNVRTERDLVEARKFVNDSIESDMITAADLARRIDAKPGAISAFRNDKWKGAAGTQLTLAADCCKAIDSILRQRQADATRVDGFVKTNVAEAIYALAEYCRKRRLLGVVCLNAGSGKTMALQALRDETPGSVLITTTGTRSHPKSFLQLWARMLGLDERGRTEDIQDRIIERLAGTDRLILIDEAHKLNVQALDTLREIRDQTNVPIVMAATPSFRTTLTSQRVGSTAKELLDQLYSRIGVFRDLSDVAEKAGPDAGVLVSIDDVRRIFTQNQVRLSRDAIELLFRIANEPASGGLRRCRDILQMAADLFEGDEVNADKLRGALRATIGVKETRMLLGSVSETPGDAATQIAAAV